MLLPAGLSALVPVPCEVAAPAPGENGTAKSGDPVRMPFHIAGHFQLQRSGSRKRAWQVGCLSFVCNKLERLVLSCGSLPSAGTLLCCPQGHAPLTQQLAAETYLPVWLLVRLLSQSFSVLLIGYGSGWQMPCSPVQGTFVPCAVSRL